MAKPKKRVKRKLRIKKSIGIKKKSEVRSDTLQTVKGRPPADVAPTLKIRIKRK